MTDPIELFREWHRAARDSSPTAHPDAMCISTVDAEGIPHARFVDLKSVRAEGFVFCTSHASPKGRHIEGRPDVSLTFWWDHAGRQVRVLGVATAIPASEADAFFAERSRYAQLVSWAYDQSRPFQSPGETPESRITAARERFREGNIPRPAHWGGYVVTPRRIEFLAFSADRAHRRILYELNSSGWARSELQP